MNLQSQRFFSAFQLSLQCLFQSLSDFASPARPPMKFPTSIFFALTARLSALLPSSFGDDAHGRSRRRYPRSRAASAPHAWLLLRLPTSCGSFVPALDSWTQSPLSVKCHRSSHAGEVTLSFRSAVLCSAEAVDAFASLLLPVTSPAELRLASSFLQSSIFGLAEDRSPRSAECCRACSTGGENPAATELRIACPHREWVFRFPSNFASRGSRREAKSPTSLESSSSCVAGNVLSNSLR
jgi:hypothetical protein